MRHVAVSEVVTVIGFGVMLYFMLVNKRAWVRGIAKVIIVVWLMFLGAHIGYTIHKCEPEPVTLYM